MNRRNFIGLSSAALAATQVFSKESAGQTISASGKPNFLVLIADDLTHHALNAVGNHEVQTPNLDRLARTGCHFTHCFHQGSWSGAVCVASRTMLNTGLSTFKAQGQEVTDQAGNKPLWGQTLRASGYDTFITGKWHLDAVGLQRSFVKQGPVGPGFLNSTPDMYDRPAPGNRWEPSNKELFGHWLQTGLWLNQEPSTIEHSSQVYADAAISYLQQTSGRKEPFFMYVAFNAPHDPRQSPQEYIDMYPTSSVKVPPNFLPEFPFDFGYNKTRDELLAPFPRTTEDVQTHRSEYYALITHMDAQIGRILDALEASGEAKNTYVIFTADHGLTVGEHGMMGKQNQFECSMRMPLIISGPGIKAGKRVDEMVYQHSMYATTCELAGIPVPKHVEFPSLVPMLQQDNPAPLYDSMFGWLADVQRSIRTSRYKLIFYPKIKRYQVFDLQKDPWEIKDLSNEAEYASVKKDLVSRLKSMQCTLGDPMASNCP